MKRCLECDCLLIGEDRVMSRKKYCSSTCKSKYRTSSGSRIDSHLWVNFKIREIEYDIILKSQGNKCAICYRDRSEFSKNFAVDHDHKCCPGKKSCGNCIRGLICFDCNIALGHLREDPKIVESALIYLNKYYK